LRNPEPHCFANASSVAAEVNAALERETQACRLVEMRTQGGEDDRLALMWARLRMAEAQSRECDAAKAQTTAVIALYKTLDGSWAVTPNGFSRDIT
jgi:outer membrane protein TolC